MPPRDERFDNHGNADLWARRADAQGGDRYLDFAGDAEGAYGRGEGNAIVFDFIRRVSYAAPPTTGLTFALFTVTQTIVRGWITDLGIGSPQFDFFGANQYYVAINDAPPYNQQYDISGGPGAAGTFFGFIPVGSLNTPRATKIPIKTGEIVQLKIAPQTTPVAGTVVYNLLIRVAGILYR